MDVFKAVKMTENVYWVGAIDWAVRDFHGYSTGRGTTYNAYLILSEKVTLIDTVKKPFFEEMMMRISSVIDPSEIEIIVSNHSELDHTGSLQQTMAAVKPNNVYASPMGSRALAAHFHWEEDPIEVVKTGESIDLGNMTIDIIETRMLHWPDSMVSYLPAEKVLFSQDGFGMHLASTERFDDELPPSVLEVEARKYYANILLPFSPLVTALIGNLGKMELEIDLLCPDHGPVWRSSIDWILGKWASWAQKKPCPKAVVIYDTMWNSTRSMAEAVMEGLTLEGVSSIMMPLRASHISDIAAEVLEASALIVGSPTINGRIFPSVAECMNYLGGLKPCNLVGAAFGSYGWSGEAVKELNGLLEGMKVELVSEGLRTVYVPDEQVLEESVNLGRSVGLRLREICGGLE
ncbi:FprA family A-type flavoprotein [Candidatus Fermentibacteria bacterium]|nr:MAG: FprA family A-type flavoprotein [Candidatus Fermentibacteria bacterium]